MAKAKKYLFYLLISLTVVGSGLLIGKQLSNLQLSSVDVTEQITSNTSQIDQKILDADYIATTINTGHLTQTQQIEVEYMGDAAIGYLTKEEAANVEEKQDVILYDQDAITLPLGGQVIEITDNGERKRIVIELPEGTATELLLNHLNIITLEGGITQRLPLSALQTDKNGNNYIWLVTKNEDGKSSKVQQKYIEPGLSNFEFFEIFNQIDSDTPVVIDPDKKIKPNHNYNIETVILDTPTDTPIRQAWLDYQAYLEEEIMKELQQAIEDCRNGILPETNQIASFGSYTSADGSKLSVSCSDIQQASDPMDIINSILHKQTGSGGCGGGGGGCGGGGCGGGGCQ